MHHEKRIAAWHETRNPLGEEGVERVLADPDWRVRPDRVESCVRGDVTRQTRVDVADNTAGTCAVCVAAQHVQSPLIHVDGGHGARGIGQRSRERKRPPSTPEVEHPADRRRDVAQEHLRAQVDVGRAEDARSRLESEGVTGERHVDEAPRVARRRLGREVMITHGTRITAGGALERECDNGIPMNEPHDPPDGSEPSRSRTDQVLDRVLSRAGTAVAREAVVGTDYDGDQLEREERAALRRVAGLSTELEDVTEVEYRQLRLERVVLVGQYAGAAADAEISLRELAALAETAGSEVLDGVLQRRAHPDPATYIGSGKAKEVRDLVASLGADTVVVNDDLAPSQRRALEDVVKVKVIDRTALILDIFAQHAKSKEGKAQVEFAQLEYLLPRLRGWGESMSRQAGGRVAGGEGIGSRGPGETKIELDRRRIRTRMAHLRRQIRAMEPGRAVRRERRGALPNVAIVGYTNAGKSSLLNRITGAGVLVENALFATLDPTVRRSRTPDGREFTVSDTVGFVRNLPHQLVAAFASTLEEVAHADLILHVVDAAHPDPSGQIRAVHEVLADVPGASDVREILVLNKCDVADADTLVALRSRREATVEISALTGAGIDALLERVGRELPRPRVRVDLVVPYTRGDLISAAHQQGEVLAEEHGASGTHVVALVDHALAARLSSAAVSAS